jgi:cytoskeletal protein RodZ
MFEIGGSLREARLKRNLTPADVQKAIRIRDRYLQALEEEHWELLPGDAYVKGFLRTYADYLGLDGNLYVDEYNNRFALPEEPLLVPERLARPGLRVGGGGLPHVRRLLAVGVVVVIVAAIAAWQLSGGSGPKQGAPPTTTVPPTTGSKPPPKKKHHKKHVSAPLPSRATLVASRGNSWLWIRAGSATGATVYEGTLLRGKKLPVNLGHGPVWIRVGNPPNLDVRLGGRLVHGLPTQVGNILLTRHGIRPA